MIQLRESWTTCQTIKVLVACHTLKVQVVRRKIERNRSFSFFWYSRKIIWSAVVIDATLQTRFGYYLQPSSGAPNDRFRGNIFSEPSRMAKIFGSPRTAKNFENVSWWLFVGLRVSGFVWFVHLRISDFVVISRSPRNFVAFVVIFRIWFRRLEIS